MLNNAVKFTLEKGEIKITTLVTPDKKHWTVAISDSGMGMTPDEIKKIFEAFAQGDHSKNSHTHQFGGLGLGLSISKMLIKMHEGSIHAHSEGRGKGATFTIQLPLPPTK